MVLAWLESMRQLSKLDLAMYFEYDNVPGEDAEAVRAYLEQSLRETPEGRRLLTRHLHSPSMYVSEPSRATPSVCGVQLLDAVTNLEHWQRADRLAALLQLEGALPCELAALIVRLLRVCSFETHMQAFNHNNNNNNNNNNSNNNTQRAESAIA